MPVKSVLGSLFDDDDDDGDNETQTDEVAANEAKSDDQLAVEKVEIDTATEESKNEESNSDVEVEKMANNEIVSDNGAQADALDNFEETFDRLKAIVEELEREDIKLGEMVRLFEEGVGLIKKCDTYLKSARERVGKYIERGDDGKWIIKGLDAEE